MGGMNIQLASDLHLERLAARFPGQTLIEPAVDADLLVLAGDIAPALDTLRLFARWPVPVIYVPGNHEFFDTDWQDTRRALRQAAQGTRVTVLDGDEWAWRGVRFLGCTLWTDYCLDGAAHQAERMRGCAERIRDHAVIRCGHESFSPRHALAEHQRCRDWLHGCLSRPFDGPTVVVTHHAPSAGSVHARFADHPVNAAYASRLEALVGRAHAWLHGHVHDSFDYRVAGAEGSMGRVVANPRGYARRREQAQSVAELEFENPAFVPQCLVRV